MLLVPSVLLTTTAVGLTSTTLLTMVMTFSAKLSVLNQSLNCKSTHSSGRWTIGSRMQTS